MMNRKRAAPSSAVTASSTASPSASKKRKTDNVQKFYAVQVGFRPGVYTTYAECAQQTAGFKGALFRSFISRSDAEAFAAGQKVATTSEGPAKYYAVAVGNPTGIFNEWDDAAEAIKGVKGPKYKRFSSRAEAVDYIREYGSMEAVMALGERLTGSTTGGTKIEMPTQVKKPTKTTRVPPPLALPQAPAGLIRVAAWPMAKPGRWAASWKRKGWVTAQGEPVKNQDIIRAVLARMEERGKAGGATQFEWVKGHASDRGNQAADALAVRGAKM
ncbi:Ribonuclease H [Beauveria bassiana D1-5]|uniref:Ribonuclease H n=1 Tax=Beauveria bassiana D1-5 TaxID=1245745 RepID=A0A0A2VHV2_BEABA|nr:Ribonuclease H [Beauveria bassiana D1-5]